MNYLTYLPILFIALFFFVVVLLKPKILGEKKSVLVAFCIGYIAHAIVTALTSWAIRTF